MATKKGIVSLPASGGEAGLNRYLAEIKKFPILSPEEEYMLAKRWREHGDTEAAAKLDADFAKYRALAEKPGDPERGKLTATMCTACHLIGTAGGQIGPNLSGVGAMGTEAILRNILTPNAAMESAYRIYRVEQKDGTVLDAFFVSEDKDAVVIEKVVYLTQESRIVTNTDMLHIPCEHQSEADERDERRRTSAISKLTILL